MNDRETDQPGQAEPDQSFGSAPGEGQFGSAAEPGQQIGEAPAPRPTPAGRNVPLLVGGAIAVLVALAAIVGFLIR